MAGRFDQASRVLIEAQARARRPLARVVHVARSDTQLVGRSQCWWQAKAEARERRSGDRYIVQLRRAVSASSPAP